MVVELRCQLGAMDVLGDEKGREDVGGVKVPAWSDGSVLGDAKGR